MDESAFRSLCGAVTGHPCAFGQALLTQYAGCRLAARHAVATATEGRYGCLSDMHWPGIVAAVVSWRGRPRRDGHR